MSYGTVHCIHNQKHLCLFSQARSASRQPPSLDKLPEQYLIGQWPREPYQPQPSCMSDKATQVSQCYTQFTLQYSNPSNKWTLTMPENYCIRQQNIKQVASANHWYAAYFFLENWYLDVVCWSQHEMVFTINFTSIIRCISKLNNILNKKTCWFYQIRNSSGFIWKKVDVI